MGDVFTVADGYLYTMLVWARFVKFDLAPWPVLQDYVARMAARPAVQQARAAESPKK